MDSMNKKRLRRIAVPSTALAGCCVYRLADGCQCKRPATEFTTWGAFCWQHASPVYAIQHVQQVQANKGVTGGEAVP
jgi:hypothetical protein